MTIIRTNLLPEPLSDEHFLKLLLSHFPAHSRPFIWSHADAEIVCLPNKTRVQLSPGLILVSLSLVTDQTGETQITIPYAVGQSLEDAALMTTTEHRVRGNPIIAARWSKVIQDAVWQLILNIGQDIVSEFAPEGDYVPGGLFVAEARLTFVPVPRQSLESVLKNLK